MEKLAFYIVDVFAEEKYAGNQLAVVRDAKALSDDEMQRIAKEMNYSETTFILSDEKRDGGYDVRIFTPKKELPFAGHPTLGTAHVIHEEIVKEPSETVVLNLKIGQIPVTFSYSDERGDVLWMKQLQPKFGRTFDAELISQILSLNVKEIDDKFPIQDVSTGVPCIIVPLKTLDALKQARIAKDRYFEFIKDKQAKGILIFCPETYNNENDLNVRFFADYYGVPEDPATGSANGCLAGYLVKHRYFGKDQINIRVEQGYEIGRPSLLLLKAEGKEEKIDVHVGGTVVMIAKGELV
ncbi:MAG: PhzF family phenazine biosynthesis protein [Candidatus Bathyarchaeota archaeon]|nr:PhzF family phenazine biosynthesis protein [Candidatus Bathyarchaeota archaeon]MDH5732303.1 PhzF family phenazine biosynthesis protein [Candidatus Bathyarchaeota archaeon]